MPIDTAAKRRSSMRRYLTPRPEADNVFDLADAQDSLWQYRGNIFMPPMVRTYRATISRGPKNVAAVSKDVDTTATVSSGPKVIAKISHA